MVGRCRAGIGERVPFAAAAEGAARHFQRVVFHDDRLGHGVGHRAVGTQRFVGLADVHQGGVAAELLEPLRQRQHLQASVDSLVGDRGLRGQHQARADRQSKRPHTVSPSL